MGWRVFPAGRSTDAILLRMRVGVSRMVTSSKWSTPSADARRRAISTEVWGEPVVAMSSGGMNLDPSLAIAGARRTLRRLGKA